MHACMEIIQQILSVLSMKAIQFYNSGFAFVHSKHTIKYTFFFSAICQHKETLHLSLLDSLYAECEKSAYHRGGVLKGRFPQNENGIFGLSVANYPRRR